MDRLDLMELLAAQEQVMVVVVQELHVEEIVRLQVI
jgi:hypothetical protein